MTAFSLCFALGVTLLARLPALPPEGIAWGGLAGLPLLCFRRARPAAAACLGFGLACLVAHHELDERLPWPLDGKQFTVAGTIGSLPEQGPEKGRFNLAVERLRHGGADVDGPDLVRLSWYDDAPPLAPGQRWRLRVKLSRPHGFANPGGFDYERWLFREGIDATGYVTGGAERLPHKGEIHLDRLRGRVARAIDARVAAPQSRALLKALAVGDRRGLDDAMWHTLNATGTSHLLAISGLHVGLVAGLGMGLGIWLARLAPQALLRLLPARLTGAALGFFLAVGYAALAGFSLPTRRALVMVAVVLGATALRRALRPWQALAAALLLVLLLDPLAPLGAGFWLSFGAVGVLLLAYAGTAGQVTGWRPLSGAQWVVALGLAPLVAMQFQRAALAAPLVNTVAIPLVGMLAVPLVLSGTAALAVPGPLAGWLFQAASLPLAAFWWLAETVASVPEALFPLPAPGPAAMASSAAGVSWLLAPRGIPARWLGLPLLIPLIWCAAPAVPQGGFRLDVLDVGQGLAAVVRTRDHVLLYDTGPAFRSGFNTARAVVSPYLVQSGTGPLDKLVVSHSDGDHAGGEAWLRGRHPPRRALAGDPELAGYRACREGMSWRWDGVRFRVLHPPPGLPYRGNASSCVIRVAGQSGSALLTGDIPSVVERRLVEVHGALLDVDVLVAPHHGSASSSSREFIGAVEPSHAVFSAGHGNPFGLPAREVAARYRQHGVALYNTARDGMVRFRLFGKPLPASTRWRQAGGRFWTAHPPDKKGAQAGYQ